MIEELQKLINDFLYKHKLNTNKIRILIKENKPNPLAISINKVDEIRHKGILPERRKDLFKLLDAMKVNYKRDSLDNIKILKRAPKKNNIKAI